MRIVHLGLGNFFRAHQAWYTDLADDASDWGIAAFTGRRRGIVDALSHQQGLYTLVTRESARDRFDVVSSLSSVHAGTDHEAWLDYFRSPDLAIVTMTVTEAGYLRATDGSLDRASAGIHRDATALQADASAPVRSVPGRLVAGLLARERAGLGPVAFVPCDNLPQNGDALRQVVGEMAGLIDPNLVDVVGRMATCVTTMVDRITPSATGADRATVFEATGWRDEAPVTTEPFTEWVMGSNFPGERPQWETAGAQITDDVAPFEQRKLWLLNGGHSLLAYLGSILGHTTVADSVADDRCVTWLREFWDEAVPYLAVPQPDALAYREALLQRFANPRMRHQLEQIATDGSQKLPVRILPVLRAERAAGQMPAGVTRALAGWISHLRGNGTAVLDVGAEELQAAADGVPSVAVPRVLGLLDRQLVDDEALVRAVADQLKELPGSR